MGKKSELIDGTCTQLLFSPKGSVEGALVDVNGTIVQVSMDPEYGTDFVKNAGPGKPMRLLADVDRSKKSKNSEHKVYEFAAFVDVTGRAVKQGKVDPDHTTIKGTVSAMHYARHGERNGVMLDSGEFIHVRPRGMARLTLKVGSTVNAIGRVRTTQLGTRLLEANTVNRVELE